MRSKPLALRTQQARCFHLRRERIHELSSAAHRHTHTGFDNQGQHECISAIVTPAFPLAANWKSQHRSSQYQSQSVPLCPTWVQIRVATVLNLEVRVCMLASQPATTRYKTQYAPPNSVTHIASARVAACRRNAVVASRHNRSCADWPLARITVATGLNDLTLCMWLSRRTTC